MGLVKTVQVTGRGRGAQEEHVTIKTVKYSGQGALERDWYMLLSGRPAAWSAVQDTMTEAGGTLGLLQAGQRQGLKRVGEVRRRAVEPLTNSREM